MSLLATAVYYFAFAKGTALLPSSIAGLLSGAIPLFTFICAWLFLSEEHINMAKAAGVALGFLGVLLMFGVLAPLEALGLILIMLGAISKKIFVWRSGFRGKSGTNGWSFDTMLVVMNLVILTTGGGNLSLMKWLGRLP